MRKTSIVNIIKRKRESNNKNMYTYKRGYTKNGVYNCKRELILQIILFILTLLIL